MNVFLIYKIHSYLNIIRQKIERLCPVTSYCTYTPTYIYIYVCIFSMFVCVQNGNLYIKNDENIITDKNMRRALNETLSSRQAMTSKQCMMYINNSCLKNTKKYIYTYIRTRRRKRRRRRINKKKKANYTRISTRE